MELLYLVISAGFARFSNDYHTTPIMVFPHTPWGLDEAKRLCKEHNKGLLPGDARYEVEEIEFDNRGVG